MISLQSLRAEQSRAEQRVMDRCRSGNRDIIGLVGSC